MAGAALVPWGAAHSSIASLLCFVILSGIAAAQDAKEKKDQPRILVTNPLAVYPGQTKTVTLRGMKLDGATEVKLSEATAAGKIVNSSKSAAPNQQSVQRVGDTQVEAEITLPADWASPGKLELTLVTPAGETEKFAIAVGSETPSVEEKEPNDGFNQAQALSLPQTVEGAIHSNQNVDVFVIEPPAGQRIVVEVMAARLGSALDAFLTIYDAQGAILATADDQEAISDPRLELKAPGGKLFVALQDANDQGGIAFPYRLLVRAAP